MGDTDLLISVVALFTAVSSAAVSALFARRVARDARLDEADQLAVRFREPLLQSAFNLQSRLFNIARQDFLQRFLVAPTATPDERDYALHNTVYLVGQYAAWVEVIRRESQYMDPRNRARNRAIAQQLESVRDVYADSIALTERVLRLFRGEQRAIGEVMLTATADRTPGVPRWECMGYAAFLEARDDPPLSRWVNRLADDVRLLGAEPGKHEERLVPLQHVLLDLVHELDPDGERAPLNDRARL